MVVHLYLLCSWPSGEAHVITHFSFYSLLRDDIVLGEEVACRSRNHAYALASSWIPIPGKVLLKSISCADLGVAVLGTLFHSPTGLVGEVIPVVLVSVFRRV